MAFFVGSLVIVEVILILQLIAARRIKTEISKSIQQMIIVGAEITLVVFLQTICTDEILSRALFGLYFCSTDWLMFIVGKFILLYTNNERYLRRFYYSFPLLIFDIFFLGLNIEHQFAFSVVKTDTLMGEFYKFVPGPLFQVHGVIIYCLVAFSLIVLAVKIVKAPFIYKKKFYFVFAVIMVIVGLNAVIMFVGDTLDFSVYGYAGGALLFYYFALNYIPGELINQTISAVSREAREGIIIFDEEVCTFANNAAMTFLKVEGDVLLGKSKEEIIKNYLDKESGITEDDMEFNYTDSDSSEPKYYKVSYHTLYDAKGEHIGGSLTIYDKTDEDKELREQIYLATHDTMTALYNREHFFTRAEEVLANDPDTKYVIIASDITRFRLVSDLFGEELADRVIIKISEELRNALPKEAIYGRLYSDRFAILLPKRLHDEKMLISIADSVNRVDKQYAYTIKMCFGVYEVVDRDLPVNVMCDRALGCITSIKEDYRKYVAYYSEESLESLKREQEIISELDDALENGDMTVFLQPIVKYDGTVVGAEALARWIHPVRGLISPGVFIPIFEKRNLIVKVDVYVWELACKILNRWVREGKDWFVSVNISTKDIYFVDVFDVFTRLVSKYSIPPEKLRIEITESAVAQDVKTVTELITRLQRIGFVVEIDDFGSGYSSLNMLKDFTADVLKIDMKFLSNADEDKRSKEILRSVISLAKNLGMVVITEGVETREQADFLEEHHCDLYQGYYYSKPVPEAEFIQKVDEIKNTI